MNRTRKRVIVTGVALVCAAAMLAMLRKPPKPPVMTLVVDRYLTNLYGPETLVALVALSNATPRRVIVSGPGLPRSRASFHFTHPALPQSIYLGPHETSDVFEMRGPGRISMKYVAFDLPPTKSTVVERFQFWMDRHLLHCDRRTNVYTQHFDIS